MTAAGEVSFSAPELLPVPDRELVAKAAFGLPGPAQGVVSIEKFVLGGPLLLTGEAGDGGFGLLVSAQDGGHPAVV